MKSVYNIGGMPQRAVGIYKSIVGKISRLFGQMALSCKVHKELRYSNDCKNCNV